MRAFGGGFNPGVRHIAAIAQRNRLALHASKVHALFDREMSKREESVKERRRRSYHVNPRKFLSCASEKLNERHRD